MMVMMMTIMASLKASRRCLFIKEFLASCFLLFVVSMADWNMEEKWM